MAKRKTIDPNFPNLVKEWDYEKNSKSPSEYGAANITKVWWKCDLNHSWQDKIINRVKGSKCFICINRIVFIGFNDLETTDPKIAKQWHPTKNGELTPQTVTKSFTKKVWWLCELNHSWESTIASKIRNAKCLICINQKVLSGFNDLATTAPEVVKDWHPTKNGDLTPQMITKGSNKKVWWLCEKKHGWQESPVAKMRNKAGCPCCSNRRIITGFNDLATKFPEIIKEWNYEKNKDLSPKTIGSGTAKKVWWKCSLGHEWEASVRKRTNYGRNCPYCSNRKLLIGFNDLESQKPEVATEWDYEKNHPLKPSELTKRSRKSVWWICKLGHSWFVAPDNRSHNEQCPYCVNKKILIGYNDLATTHPELIAEWNDEKDMKEFTYGADYKAQWRCINSHIWKATISSRTGKDKNGCYECSILKASSQLERELQDFVSKIIDDDIIFNSRKIIPPKEIDIFISEKNIALEFNGTYWHSEKGGKDSEYHAKKFESCSKKSIRLFSIWSDAWEGETIQTSTKNGLHELLTKELIDIPNSVNIRQITQEEKIAFEKIKYSFVNNKENVFGMFNDDQKLIAICVTRAMMEDNCLYIDNFISTVGYRKTFVKFLKYFSTNQKEQYEKIVIVSEKDSLMNYICENIDELNFIKDIKSTYRFFKSGRVYNKDDEELLKKFDREKLIKIWGCSRNIYEMIL